MKLSKKYTTIYIVIATWCNAEIEVNSFSKEDEAKKYAARKRFANPYAFVQIHTIDQALPEVPKP